MKTSTFAAAAGALAFAGGLMLSAAPASALTMQECSAKYNAAKTANTLGGASWNDFRKTQCNDDVQPAAPPAAKAQPTAPAARNAAPVATAKNVVFPRSVDRKYASEKPSRAIMKTCVDQYNENKANGGNGELKWIMKGGGYYSQCNALLKKQQGA